MLVRLKDTYDLIDDDKRINLEKGKTYIVYGVIIWKTGVVFAIKSFVDFSCPYLLPSDHFDIVDASIPSGWKMVRALDVYNASALRISFPEMAEEDGFYSRLYDGEPREKKIFEKKVAEYEALYSDFLS